MEADPTFSFPSGDPVDHAERVVGEVEAAVRADDRGDGPAPGPAVGAQPAGDEILDAGRPALRREADAHQLVAGRRLAVPGAVEGDEEGAAILGREARPVV